MKKLWKDVNAFDRVIVEGTTYEVVECPTLPDPGKTRTVVLVLSMDGPGVGSTGFLNCDLDLEVELAPPKTSEELDAEEAFSAQQPGLEVSEAIKHAISNELLVAPFRRPDGRFGFMMTGPNTSYETEAQCWATLYQKWLPKVPTPPDLQRRLDLIKGESK